MLMQHLKGHASKHMTQSLSALPAGPAAMVAASGPFMSREILAAGHLHGLLQACRQQAPLLLLLLGPFLDEEHPAIRSGDVDEHFEAVFEREVGTVGDPNVPHRSQR